MEKLWVKIIDGKFPDITFMQCLIRFMDGEVEKINFTHFVRGEFMIDGYYMLAENDPRYKVTHWIKFQYPENL